MSSTPFEIYLYFPFSYAFRTQISSVNKTVRQEKKNVKLKFDLLAQTIIFFSSFRLIPLFETTKIIKNELTEGKKRSAPKYHHHKWDKLYDLNVCFVSIITHNHYKHFEISCVHNPARTHIPSIHRLWNPYREKQQQQQQSTKREFRFRKTEIR